MAAVNLHRAFVDAAAKPLRHNLGALMNLLAGNRLKTSEQQALLPDLWSSLFLVVPLVSTTFASVGGCSATCRRSRSAGFSSTRPGRPRPSQAVGALMRARRAVVVGDPVQIEPVVTLPSSLTHAICSHFRVDSDKYDAPAASVQTLADAATRFTPSFPAVSAAARWACRSWCTGAAAEPMFGIANAVAYDRRMVQATPAAAVSDRLGARPLGLHRRSGSPPPWTNIRPRKAPPRSACCTGWPPPARRPTSTWSRPSWWSPRTCGRLIREDGRLAAWLGGDSGAWASQNVGTVHTVQGREAEAVILVLGAPGEGQNGARIWAGGAPNLLNVAVTRARERLYVIGNRAAPGARPELFRELDLRLP